MITYLDPVSTVVFTCGIGIRLNIFQQVKKREELKEKQPEKKIQFHQLTFSMASSTFVDELFYQIDFRNRNM